MMKLSRRKAKEMLEVVAYSERIKSDINILERNGEPLVSVEAAAFPQFGRQEFTGKHLREAAWKASLWISKLGSQI